MKSYCIVILKPGPNRYISGVEQIKWEHVRRNFLLRFEGKLPIVSPVADGCGISGIGIFNAGIDETRSIMEKDPAVAKGVFSYEIHSCRSFPGDCLP